MFINKLTKNIKNEIESIINIKCLNITNCRLSSLDNIPVM